jgi:threonine aldolase
MLRKARIMPPIISRFYNTDWPVAGLGAYSPAFKLSSEQRKAMNFSSDNVAGAHEAVLRAVVKASANAVPAYGDDALSAEAETALQNLFETECAVFFVTTGTAANALVLSAICPPWGAVYCHVDAHILNDENTAVELFSGWCTVGGYCGSRR